MIAVVEAAGGSAATLLKVTVYLVGVWNWLRFNTAMQRLWGMPGRRDRLPVPELHYGYLVEVDAVAARPA